MKLKTKRFIFFGMLCGFLVYTVIVATKGTENDPGKAFYSVEASSGKLLFQKYNCTSCHQLYGLGGYMGPDLTNVISSKGKGKDYARALMKYGSQRMPNFNLSDSEVDDLLAFLSYVDKTGRSPVTSFDIQTNGTVNIKE
jgi:nitric oxide reductase subunit C